MSFDMIKHLIVLLLKEQYHDFTYTFFRKETKGDRGILE